MSNSDDKIKFCMYEDYKMWNVEMINTPNRFLKNIDMFVYFMFC